MVRGSKEGWKTSWGSWVEGKSTQQRGMEKAAENGKELLHSAHAIEWINEWMNLFYIKSYLFAHILRLLFLWLSKWKGVISLKLLSSGFLGVAFGWIPGLFYLSKLCILAFQNSLYKVSALHHSNTLNFHSTVTRRTSGRSLRTIFLNFSSTRERKRLPLLCNSSFHQLFCYSSCVPVLLTWVFSYLVQDF